MLGPARSRRLDQPIAVSLEALVPVDHSRFFNQIQVLLVKINIPLDEMNIEKYFIKALGESRGRALRPSA